jgi:putative ABC transport system permease protein
MLLQVRYLKHTDMGFNRDAVVMLPIVDTSQLKKDLLAKKIVSIPQIKSFSFCFKAPSSKNDRGGSVYFNNRPDWETWPARSAIGDTSYVESFGLQLVAGRNIREVSGADHEFLINQMMVSKLGFKSPGEVLGKELIAGELDNAKGVIVGVVKDFNTKSLLEPIEPVLITTYDKMQSTLGIKLSGHDLKETISRIQTNFEEVYPEEVFDYQFLDDQIAKLYRKEDLNQKLIWVAASVAVMISCLGLLSLVSLITLQRNKEIGIRKILGASVSSLVGVLTVDFVKLIGISILIASPIAWYGMHLWLQGYAYKININWWIFVLAGFLTILISLITISFQTIKAAIANPIKSLRTE